MHRKIYKPVETKPKKRGIFVCFEGVDRAGKSTQVKALQDFLLNEGIPVVVIRFPDRETPSGIRINKLLKGEIDMTPEESHHLFVLNRHEKKNYIISLLENGVNVIADRYSYSGITYSSVLGLDPDYCLRAEVSLPKPDLIIHLDLDIEQLITRYNFGNEIFDNKHFQINVRAHYEKIFKYETNRVKIDASLPIKVISIQVFKIFRAAQHNNKYEPISYFI